MRFKKLFPFPVAYVEGGTLDFRKGTASVLPRKHAAKIPDEMQIPRCAGHGGLARNDNGGLRVRDAQYLFEQFTVMMKEHKS